jgi:hypothetical protein
VTAWRWVGWERGEEGEVVALLYSDDETNDKQKKRHCDARYTAFIIFDVLVGDLSMDCCVALAALEQGSRECAGGAVTNTILPLPLTSPTTFDHLVACHHITPQHNPSLSCIIIPRSRFATIPRRRFVNARQLQGTSRGLQQSRPHQ